MRLAILALNEGRFGLNPFEVTTKMATTEAAMAANPHHQLLLLTSVCTPVSTREIETLASPALEGDRRKANPRQRDGREGTRTRGAKQA